jgi:hypothetical protein
MKNHITPDSHETPETGQSVWQQLKKKRISYLSIPLLVMAAVVEFVILSIGWKYQQVACLPQGMGIVFFGIGPIGATILAVELLKLPLAAWTASRQGWQKAFMLVAGLPLICVLTFQLVKDMAVYEMGVAMTPASQMLEKAAAEEIKIKQLQGELAAIEQKKAEREQKLAELAAKKAKAKADLDEALKHNEATRQDAITLTDYQKTELATVEARQATIIQQFNADTAQLNKELAELRARRETELARATAWNAEEARIENAYKAQLAEYTNKKMAYEKEKANYDNAHFLVRKVMREPVHPGVPPEREMNKILKPTLITTLDEQIKAKEAELVAVNNTRRDRVAQVDADARRLREDFDRRSVTKREETDRKREELSAALVALTAGLNTEAKQIDAELATAVQKVDGIRAEIDTARKNAERYYEAREAAIKNTQVHRIATTVEIVRGWVFGERPLSITASAKERGDVYTDQISMVRIWVYPVLAFLVAFLPTLMVEIGFSTLFKPEPQRPAHRLGFFGRRLHWLYTRAGRLKILRAERQAKEATAQIAARDAALAAAKASAEKALAEKEAALQAAQASAAAAAASHAEQLKQTEEAWVAKLAGMADSLNRAIIEKDSLRDLQKSEIERQIQLRQNAWSDRLTQLRQELDDQRAASEAERTTLLQEHHKKLMEVTEDCKKQISEARRQVAAAELAAVESSAKLAHDLKEARHARDTAEAQLKHQADFLALQLTQAQEDAARELEKVTRQEKHRFERQQLEFDKALRQQAEDYERRWRHREQELAVAFDAQLVAEKTQTEEAARRHAAELDRQWAARVSEVEARWNQEVQQREEAAQIRLKQREQQLQAQAEARLSEAHAQAEQELRRVQSDFERQLGAQEREAIARARQELQQKELAFHAQLKQREQELTAQATARETELQNQWAADLRARQEEMERQADARVRATEARLGQEAQQKEELLQIKLRQREQQLQAQLDTQRVALQAQHDQELCAHEVEWERNADARVRATEARWQAELHQKEELFQSTLRQRDEQAQAKLESVRRELQTQAEQEFRRRDAESAEARLRVVREVETNLRKEMQAKLEAAQASIKQREQDLVTQLAAKTEAQKITEQERDEARKIAFEVAREAQDLKDKLQEASSLLTGWNNGHGKYSASQYIVK